MTPHEQDMLQLVDRLRERLENWATESVKQAGELGDLKRWLAAAEAERDALKSAVERVRALHVPEQPPEGLEWVSGGAKPHCKGCATGDPFLDAEWPCDTVRALEAK